MPILINRSIAIHGSPVGLMTFPPAPFGPFPVPQFPVSQLHWLSHLAKLFLTQQQRCVVVTLMLDAAQQKWVRPQIPTQRCGRDGACWSHDEDDYTGRPPAHLIGGSFQSAHVRSLDEAVSLVPAVDGMHLINNVHDEPSLVYVFAHHNGQAHAVEAGQFFINDVAYTLDQHRDQLVLA